MIELQAESVWRLDEELDYSVHASSEMAAEVSEMAHDESFISWRTADPLVRELCDFWEIKYTVV